MPYANSNAGITLLSQAHACVSTTLARLYLENSVGVTFTVEMQKTEIFQSRKKNCDEHT